MKATLKFNLPEDQAEFDAARLGREALSTLWDIDQHCRGLLKHGEPEESERRLAETIRSMIPYSIIEGM